MKAFFSLSLLAFLFVGSISTFAQEEAELQNPEINFSDEQDVPRGLYLAMGAGWWYFTGADDRAEYGDAWVTSLKLGYDVFKYLGVELQYKFSGHQNAARGVVAKSSPGSHFSHQMLGVIRGMYPLTRRWTFSLDAGGGLWLTRPNIKPAVTQNGRGIFVGGLGVQYFTKIKGVVIGLDPTMGFITNDIQSPVVQASGYIRYTF